MTFQRFEIFGESIGLKLIVPGEDPHFPMMLDPDLGRAEDMSRGVKGECYTVYFNGITIRNALEVATELQPVANYGRSTVCTQILFMPEVCMIGVTV
jgi:hypothetical protein